VACRLRISNMVCDILYLNAKEDKKTS